MQPQQPTVAATAWIARSRHALLLAACADLFAARFTVAQSRPTPVQVDVAMNSPTRNPQPSTAFGQALVTAAHLARHGGHVQAGLLATELAVQWASTRDHTGGTGPSGTRQVLAGVLAGDSWHATASSLRGGQGSAGSDAAVRAIAAGLLPPQHISVITVAARAAAAVTHSHPLAGDGAAVLATALAMAARGLPSTGVTAGRFLAMAATGAVGPQFPSLLPMVRTLCEHHAGPAEAAATLRPGATTLRTVPAALTAFLRHPADPVAAIRYALLMAGPNRAVAAMTGALAGAACTQFSVPAPWLPPAALRQDVRAAATGLASLSPATVASQPDHAPTGHIQAGHR